MLCPRWMSYQVRSFFPHINRFRIGSLERRFATFKLFYNDKTPPEYEPPHFQAGDAQKDKWYFMTHDLDEVPDRWSIGRVKTGYHS